MTPSEERLYRFAVSKARMRDRLYFGADATAAAELGVSRRTILRCRHSLEAQGWLERCGVHRWPSHKTTVCYRFPRRRVTQRTSYRNPVVQAFPVSKDRSGSSCPQRLSARGRKGCRMSRPRDLIWDEMTKIFGEVAGPSNAHGRRNKAVKDLKILGASPETVRLAHERWATTFPGARCTDIALATHYPLLLISEPLPAPRRFGRGVTAGELMEEVRREAQNGTRPSQGAGDGTPRRLPRGSG